MPIEIAEATQWIERCLIGFGPNTRSVSPVHIANGLFRGILGMTTDTELLNRFVFYMTDRGRVPPGHELESVYSALTSGDLIYAGEISADQLPLFRKLLKRVVGADGGVYMHRDLMESYSAGYMGFVSEDRIAQDGGEFVAEWMRRCDSPLMECIDTALQEADDVITTMCGPLLASETKPHTSRIGYEDLQFFNKHPTAEFVDRDSGLAAASATLSTHLTAHPNKLVQLRMAVLFACFVIIRHMANLEWFYAHGARSPVTPFLIESGEVGSSPVTRASMMTHTIVCQSVSRFYTWAFEKYLLEKMCLTMDDLLEEPVPVYRRGSMAKRERAAAESAEMWNLAKNHGMESSVGHFAQAIYDMLMLQAEASPIKYMQRLGLLSGLIWPPNRSSGWFVLKQDMMEVLVRGAVEPQTAIDLPELQDRFWKRYGIVIGGRDEDEDILDQAGVQQVDSDALRENGARFATRLGSLDFARMMADGVLQVEVG